MMGVEGQSLIVFHPFDRNYLYKRERACLNPGGVVLIIDTIGEGKMGGGRGLWFLYWFVFKMAMPGGGGGDDA